MGLLILLLRNSMWIKKGSNSKSQSILSYKMLFINKSRAVRRSLALVWRLYAWSFQSLHTARTFRAFLRITTTHSSRKRQMVFCKFFNGGLIRYLAPEVKLKFQYLSKSSLSFTESGWGDGKYLLKIKILVMLNASCWASLQHFASTTLKQLF